MYLLPGTFHLFHKVVVGGGGGVSLFEHWEVVSVHLVLGGNVHSCKAATPHMELINHGIKFSKCHFVCAPCVHP